MAEEKKILDDALYYTISRYLAYFFTALTGLIIVKSLGPLQFGIYSALMLIITYSVYSHLGLFHYFLKRFPYLVGKDDTIEADNLKNNSFTFGLYINIVIAVLLMLISFFADLSNDVLISLRLIALIIIVRRIYNIFFFNLRVNKEFKDVSIILLIYSLSMFIMILTCFFVGKLNIVFVFFSSLVSYTIVTFYLWFKKGFPFKLHISPKTVYGYLKLGLPLLTMSIMFVILSSIDKIMILKFLDPMELGFYSIGILITQLIIFVPQSISAVLYPHTMERFGKSSTSDNLADLKAHLFVPTRIIAFLMPLVVGFFFLVSPFVVHYIFPSYLSSIMPIKILVFAIYFMAIIIICTNVLIGMNKENKIIIFIVAAILLAVTLNLVFLKLGYGIVGVAIATMFTHIAYCLCILKYTFSFYIKPIRKLLLYFLKLLFPFIYLFFFVLLFDKIIISGELVKDTALLILKLSLFVVVYLPFIWYLNKKTGVLKLIYINYIKRQKKLP